MEVIKKFGSFKKVKTDDNKWGYIDKDDNIIVDAKYDYLGNLQSGGFITTKNNNLWGLIKIKDGRVKEICDEKYSYISSYKSGSATVLKETGYNFIDEAGSEIFEQDFTEVVQRLPGGLAVVSKDNLFGIVCTITGKVIYPCTYTSIQVSGKKIKLQQEFTLS